MKTSKLSWAIFLSLTSYGSSCFADGTVDFEQQVLPLINQRPFFAQFLTQTFVFEKDAVGTTVGANVSQKLELTRVGPYRVCARLRSSPSSDSCSVQVVIDTDTHFFDKNGREIDGPQGAQSVKEGFYAIEVNPPPNQSQVSTSESTDRGDKDD
ncbi:hypothetical protein [Paraburkholderia dipogonis]|uniref:hypothetical protein n=1 Tax=Paraburkholderia dipogonis TaxID=1211383 RepID=UPI0038BA5213